MNKLETRQLGIEFERRIQEMMPQTEFLDKLDTETIYSFLNQYQDKLIHSIFQSLDTISDEQKLSSRIDILLKGLLCKVELTEVDGSSNNNTVQYTLPEDPGMAMYIRSTSYVDKYYRKNASSYDLENPQPIVNTLVPNADIVKYLEAPNNDLRILRAPIAAINDNVLVILHDRYTHVSKVELTYYKNPAYFSPLTSVNCELPIDMFDDLVSGAIALYVQYVAGQSQKQNKKEDKED